MTDTGNYNSCGIPADIAMEMDLLTSLSSDFTREDSFTSMSLSSSISSVHSAVLHSPEASSSPDFSTCQAAELDKNSSTSLRGRMTNGLSSATSKDPLLDELLGTIRRSCATSLASTPTTNLSEGEGDNVFECKLRRSEAELRSLDISELQGITDTLSKEVDCVSSLLVRLLQMKVKETSRVNRQANRLSSILRDFAKQNDLSYDLSFSLHPPSPDLPNLHEPWKNSWRVLSHLPKGIPKAWRKSLWNGLTSTSPVSLLDWPSIFVSVYSEYAMPGDEALGSQIVKDLHRTGDTGFTSEVDHAILKRVLLAYARFNKTTGYCQGFNILAALILKVVDFDEHAALKIMVNLIDFILPDNYFAQNLYALSVDMATFRELMKHVLPELNVHIENLQKEASGTLKKSYSSESPPDIQSIHAYEPPLADVFTMQWFLTIFASSLPRKATRRVWDFIFLEGSEVLLYTGIAIMAVMEKDLLQTYTAADFYSTMAFLGERLRKSQLISSSEFMQVIYTVKDCITAKDSSIPPIRQLREKYAYNICPCADPDQDKLTDSRNKSARPCPKPSRGGAFSLSPFKVKETKKRNKKLGEDGGGGGVEKEEEFVSGQRNSTIPEKDLEVSTISTQIKLLHDHYILCSRQPAKIRCAISLAPPQARATCPQAKYGGFSSAWKNNDAVYGPDVPKYAIEKSKMLSGQDTLDKLTKQKKVFTIAYRQPFADEDALFGMELELENDKSGKSTRFQGKSGILGNVGGPRGKLYLSNRERLLRSAK